jgi:ABC-type transporter Mla subunit MlaD
MSQPQKRTSRRAAAFIAVAVILVAVALLRSGRVVETFGDGFVLYAASSDAFGTVKGSVVRVYGVEVGAVSSVDLVRDPERPDKPVRITIRVSPYGASFLKEHTVAHVERVHMGTGVPPFAKPPIELWTEGTARLPAGSIIETVGEETMVESFASLSRDVGAVRKRLDQLSDVFDDARTITRALAGREGVAGRLIHDPETADSLTHMIGDARKTTAAMQRLVEDARALSDKAPPLLADMKGMSEEGRRVLTGMGRAVDDLPRMLKAAERTLKLAEELVVNLRAASVYAPELARKVDTSIEETNRLVDAAQRSVILRSTLPERRMPRTESEVRPPIPIEMESSP